MAPKNRPHGLGSGFATYSDCVGGFTTTLASDICF